MIYGVRGPRRRGTDDYLVYSKTVTNIELARLVRVPPPLVYLPFILDINSFS